MTARVCILTSVHPALDTRIFHKQARTLAAAGYRVRLLAQHPQDEWREGVEIRALPAGLPRALRPLLWWRLLIEALRSRAAVYHIHDPELLPLAWLLQALSQRPVIYDAHEYYGDEVRTRHWIPALLRAPAGWLTERIEKTIAGHLAAVVTVNEHMRAGFLRVQPRSVAVRNYPPVEYFAATQPVVRACQIVYAGVLTRERGIETVYDAARLLHARYPDLEIAIAGPLDWSGVERRVPRDAAAWQHDCGVRFLGTLPQRQVAPLLQGAAAGWIPFLATPNNVRSTPNKLLEYMAAALPVVASNFGYLREIIEAADCGLLATGGDAAAQAEQLAWLLDHPAEARAMGDRGRATVLARYTWAGEAKTLLALYRELRLAREGNEHCGR